MSMIDYGVIVIKNGNIINKDETFLNMKEFFWLGR